MATYECQIHVHESNNRRKFKDSDTRCSYACSIQRTGFNWGEEDQLLGVLIIITRELTAEQPEALVNRELAFNKDDLYGALLIPNRRDQLTFVEGEE